MKRLTKNFLLIQIGYEQVFHLDKVFTFSISAHQMHPGVMVGCYGPMNHVFKEFGVNIGFAHFQAQNPGFLVP